MRFRQDQRGQMLVLTAVCMAMMMGFVALAVDVGLLFRAKRNIQIAADSAAIAAALDYLYNNSVTSAQAAGKAASASNFVTNGTNGATVTINIPPSDAVGKSVNGAVEAIVSMPNPTFFWGAFSNSLTAGGGAKTSIPVAARAVAGVPDTGTACIWLMDTSGVGLQLQGAYDIEAPTCGIYVNSPSSNALQVTGNGGTLNALFLDVVGNSPPSHQTNPTPATINAGPRSTPWGNLSGPNPATACNGGNTVTASTVTAALLAAKPPSGGVVCFSSTNVTLSGGLTLPGSASGVVYLFEGTGTVSIGVGSAVTFGSGTYNAGTGQFSSTSGAVMDLYAGTLSQASNNLLNIYAPTAGTYDGIALFQPASNTNELQVQKGSNNQTLDGYIYAPGAEVYLQDNGGGISATGIVASYLYDKSSSITIPSYDAANPTTTLNRIITLLE